VSLDSRIAVNDPARARFDILMPANHRRTRCGSIGRLLSSGTLLDDDPEAS